MARIPMGNFGNAMPQVERIQMPENQSGQMIANSLQNAGNTISQIAQKRDEEQRQQEITNKNIELYQNKLQTQEAQLKLDESLTTDFSDKVADIKNRVGNGDINAQQADEELKTWSADKFSQLKTELPGHSQQELQQYWDSNVNRQRGSFFPLQLKATEQKGVVLSDRYFDVATRMGREDGKNYLLQNLSTLPLSQAQKENLALKYESTRDIIEVNKSITDAVAANDISALEQTATGLKDKKYLDGTTVQKYQTEITSKISALQQKQQVNENKRLNEAEKVLNDFKQNVLTGQNLDLSYQNNVETAVKGTALEGEYEFYKKQSSDFIRFSKLSTNQQLAEINQRKVKQKESSSADPVAENKILSTYQSIYDAKLKTNKENPTQALREKGIQLPEINAAEIKVNPAQFVQNVVTIGSYQVAQQNTDSNATVKPIPEESLPDAKKAWSEAGVSQKIDLIGNLISQSKGIKGGEKIWGAALGQLSNGDRAYIMAGVARMKNFRSSAGLDVALAIVAGKQALKNKQMIQPKDDILKQKFNDYVGQSVSGVTANLTFEAYKSIYAYLTETRGQQHKDADDYNKDIGNTALSLATGGTYTQDGDFKDYTNHGIKDWKVSKPYGMSDSRFESLVLKGYLEISKKTGRSVNDLKNFRLKRRDEPDENGNLVYLLKNERGVTQAQFSMQGVTK
ncbi:methyl-coenzyme M reductase [Acinetobacter ursingii]|uniref:Methyl-coenzyme M reductase n=1 Tax=Acinetobacter ursingii TaxID=108980 RepID=A0AA46S5L0_9GAMM|nr:methyl-coenzyme M reductase [Acinetobacter ursingii]UYF72780.1 methyl-coenzyme M reductase [Acinetobacter ursingii]